MENPNPFNIQTSDGSEANSSAIIGGVNNCTIPDPCNPYPGLGSWPSIVTSTNFTLPSPDLSIRKVNNGFVVKQGYGEYVFENVDSLVTFIKTTFKEKKK